MWIALLPMQQLPACLNTIGNWPLWHRGLYPFEMVFTPGDQKLYIYTLHVCMYYIIDLVCLIWPLRQHWCIRRCAMSSAKADGWHKGSAEADGSHKGRSGDLWTSDLAEYFVAIQQCTYSSFTWNNLVFGAGSWPHGTVAWVCASSTWCMPRNQSSESRV